MGEKKILVNEEMEEVNFPQPIQTEKKNNNKTTGILLMLIILAIIGILVYVLVLKPKDEEKPNNTTTPSTTVLTNDEALSIVKERVEAANSFLGNFESSSECTDKVEDGYCYYDTLDNFNDKFYSIYSKSLTYADVFNDNVEGAPSLKQSNNKAYIWNHCTMGSGDKSLKGDYKIESITSDTIIAEYVFLDTDPISGSTSNVNAEVKLVKEDTLWKVAKITLLGICNGIYDVGK